MSRRCGTFFERYFSNREVKVVLNMFISYSYQCDMDKMLHRVINDFYPKPRVILSNE
jgi:hypothetical protein